MIVISSKYDDEPGVRSQADSEADDGSSPERLELELVKGCTESREDPINNLSMADDSIACKSSDGTKYQRTAPQGQCSWISLKC